MKKLVKLLIVGGIVAAVGKALMMQKQQWQGLTETEARAKIDAKLPAKVEGEKRAEVTDKIVGAMKDKGVLVPDAAPEGNSS